RKLPIIAVTASAGVREREKCVNAGMNDFLLKPFRQEELSGKIASWLSDATPAADDSSGATSVTMKDVASRLDQMEEDYGKEMVQKIIRMFIPDAEVRIEKIDQAIRQEDSRALEEAAHGLKSGAANIGATEMARLSEELETRGEIGS